MERRGGVERRGGGRGVKRTTEFVQNNQNLRHWLVKESDRLFHTEKRAKIKLIYSKY